MMNPTEHPEYQRVKQEVTAALQRIPPYMHDAIMEYVMQGRDTGAFLTAVFANNFNAAVRKADDSNRSFLFEYTEMLLVIPMAAWGDAKKVKTWQQSQGMYGLIQRLEAKPEPEGGG